MKYIKQLDSIRAIAVIFVIISHWVPETKLINRTPNGFIGVEIFFVLSGFLITRILFENKKTTNENSTLLKNFYLRRTLRIFPIYYLTIFILLLIHESTGTNIKSAFVYFATYTSNFYFFNVKHWEGMISHLWSLAVEEQFYLLWPWVIVFTPRKYYLQVIGIFIIVGVTSKLMLADVPFSGMLPFTCFDAFGFGALLAWFTTFNPTRLPKFYTVVSVVAAIAFVFFAWGLKDNSWPYIPLGTIIPLIALWLITYVTRNSGEAKPRRSILNFGPLVFLGKISYGIYLYHNIIPQTLNANFINKYLNPHLPNFLYKKHWGELYLLENIILLIVVAYLSYVFIEKPFLNLKRHFEYQAHKVSPQ